MHRAAAIAAIAALAGLAPPALAQVPNAPAQVPSAPVARAALTAPRAAGDAQFAAGRYREALALYKQALRQSGDASLLFDIGQCHQRLGEPKEEAAAYRSFVVLVPNDARVPQARALLAQLPAAPALHRQRTLLLTLGGGAVMAVSAGLYFGSRSRTERASLHNELHVAYDVLQRENSMVDDAHRANLLFVVSAALAVAGTALFLLEF